MYLMEKTRKNKNKNFSTHNLGQHIILGNVKISNHL